MNYKLIIPVLFLIYFGSASKIKADRYIDSLQNLILNLERANLTDTVLNTRFELIKYVENTDYKLFLELSEQNIALAQKNHDNWALIDVYMEMGEVLITKGIYGVALNDLNKAMSLAITDEYKSYVGWIDIAIGNAYGEMLNYSKGIDFYKSALRIFTEQKNIDGIGLAATNLGTNYSELKDYKNAEYYFKMSLDFREKLENPVELGYSRMFYIESKIKQGNFVEAESELNSLSGYVKSVTDSKKMNYLFQEAMVLEAEVYSLLADCEKHNLNFEKEFFYLNEAVKIYQSINDDLHLAFIYNQIGNRYLELKKYPSAFEYADIALKIAKKSSLLNEQSNSLKLKADAFYSLGKFKDALEFFREEKIINDSIYSSSVIQAISNVDVLLGTMEKEKDNQILSLKIAQDRKLRLFIVAAAICFILMALGYSIFVYRRYKKEKKLGLMLQEKNRQILEQSTNLEALNMELTVINKSKDRFHSIIAHDLKNPVSTFCSIAGLLKESYDSMPEEQIRELIDMAYHTAEGNLKLLDTLLAWSRTQGGHLNLNKSDFYIGELVSELVGSLKNMADLKGVSLKIDEISRIKINADKEMITTVIRNLCTNAIKYTPGGKEIQVGARKSDGNLEVWVKDNGIGIPKEKLDELFEIDTHLQRNGTNNEPGTGLGLQLCLEFIKLHKGKIMVESEAGKGSLFSFRIPFEQESPQFPV